MLKNLPYKCQPYILLHWGLIHWKFLSLPLYFRKMLQQLKMQTVSSNLTGLNLSWSLRDHFVASFDLTGELAVPTGWMASQPECSGTPSRYTTALHCTALHCITLGSQLSIILTEFNFKSLLSFLAVDKIYSQWLN